MKCKKCGNEINDERMYDFLKRKGSPEFFISQPIESDSNMKHLFKGIIIGQLAAIIFILGIILRALLV